MEILSNEEEGLEEEELNSISLYLLSPDGEPAHHLAKLATYLLMVIQLIKTLGALTVLGGKQLCEAFNGWSG
ncbi:hypothetical protein Pst134EA_020879 [Puccinia striiformis f. sp. tritici]|uniref:hypothetical protein n=1 Tax=Puccinia striiformis f. sp. tritici TaxID=168172 RepID=UPI002008870D|nr:hypothetical protein Pst134EA_020879 [Puccinia striiformis f. sp. tritici]KAH9456973.1 hypothetical protein Pst134EA_020879 [Puccinia striiformis f. sp. tritici]